jgi:hypothetical protein
VRRVAIIGCGPTGLMAAHACKLNGVDFTVYSKRRKSFLFGSQYLHEPIPDLVEEREGRQVQYINVGTPEEYRRKTHGKFWDGIIAPEDFETEHVAWNIREAYDRLWMRYGRGVVDAQINDGICYVDGRDWMKELAAHDLVISTVPRRLWAVEGDGFRYSEGWALGDAPEHGVFVPYDITDNTIICDGSSDNHYNRLSKVFGYTTVEWPIHADMNVVTSTPGMPAPSKFLKPLAFEASTTHENPTSDWLHVGRFGAWRKAVLVTDAWHDTNNKLKELGV